MRRLGRVIGAVIATTLLASVAVAAQDIPAPTPPADGELAFVLEVTDGDTIRVDRDGGGSERLRYIGIDTPETVHPEKPVEPWGPQATAANKDLVKDRLVLLERDVSDRDRFDRLLRYVWVEEPDGWVLVNAELVARGLARVHAYEPDTKYHAYFRQLEDEARRAGMGMHGSDEPDETDEAEQGLLGELFDFFFGG